MRIHNTGFLCTVLKKSYHSVDNSTDILEGRRQKAGAVFIIYLHYKHSDYVAHVVGGKSNYGLWLGGGSGDK